MTGRACLEQGLQALPMDIPARAVEQFLAFSDRLLEKNKVMNLTAVTDPDEVISRHFLDCAVLAPRMISGEKMIAILIMLASPTTPSCYIMAKSMNNDEVLTASVIVTTTLMAAFTLTGWIFLLKTLGYIG